MLKHAEFIIVTCFFFVLTNSSPAELNCQRIFLRIMKSNHWIDEHKFNVAMEQIYEIGKILGGLIKSLGVKTHA